MLRRGRDRIEPRLQLLQSLDEGFGADLQAGELVQSPQHVEQRQIAVRVLAARERLRLRPRRAARDEGDELEQAIGRRAQRPVADQRMSRRVLPPMSCSAAPRSARSRIGEARIVRGEHPKGIAGLVVESGRSEVELDVIGLLLGAVPVELAPAEKDGLRRIVAGSALVTDGLSSAALGSAGRPRRRRVRPPGS